MTPFEGAPPSHAAYIDRPEFARTALRPPGWWKDLESRHRSELLESAFRGIFLAYQPIVSSGREGVPTVAYEALLRTHDRRISDPTDLVELAAACGKVRDLGYLVRLRASEALADNAGLTLFVNVDVEELVYPLGDSEDPLLPFASRVVLEVTERAPLGALPEIRQQSEQFQAKGYRFAIDDLGGGYAGLANLALIDPHFVKIDRSLVSEVDARSVNREIVGSVLGLCRQLGILCIGEGVETEAQRAALAGLGCDLMQGFLFGYPGTLGGA